MVINKKYHFKLALNAKIKIMINALNAISQINEKKNLMEMHMENAYVILDIMMMAQIIYAYNAIIVGNKIKNLILN